MPLPFQGPPADVKGSGLPTPQATRRRFRKGEGHTTVNIWYGPDPATIEGLYTDLILAGYTEVDIGSPTPGVYSVEASIPGVSEGEPPDPPEDSWVLASATEIQDIATHPLFGATLTSEDINKITDAINQGEAMPTLGSSPAQNLGRKLYDLLSHGHKTYYKESPILRHTQTVATLNEVALSFAGVGNVVSAAGLPANMPATIIAAINTIEFGPVISNMTQGWLKTSGEVHDNIFTRVDVIEEWKFDYWAIDIYA